MAPSEPAGDLREVVPGPLVRATRNQAEIDLLPPYGDPEVSYLGELVTYAALGASAAVAYHTLRRT